MLTGISRTTVLVLGVAAAGLGSPSIAVASPDDMCRYRVSAPQLQSTDGGVSVVTTTFHVVSCPGTWQPTKSKVCIAPSTGGGNCVAVYGWGPGRASVPLTSASSTYEATAQGCARLDQEVERCIAADPVRVDVS